MKIEFLREAEQELFEAADWYDFKASGLGKRFKNEVALILERIIEDPMIWRERPGGYRRVNCPIFPYYVSFFIRGNRVIIAAVAHEHRKPGYWKSRT